MFRLILLPVLSALCSVSASDRPSSDHANCSLLFTIQTKDASAEVQTSFPLEFLAHYNSSCHIHNATAYYKITPLDTLVIGNDEHENEEVNSKVELHNSSFRFSINQSSTIRLCIVSSDEADHLCRQIHIGITELHNFWNMPMKIFYIFWICLLGTYHILFWLRNKWRKSGKKSKSRTIVVKPSPTTEKKHDTFENEKINEDVSDDEDEG